MARTEDLGVPHARRRGFVYDDFHPAPTAGPRRTQRPGAGPRGHVRCPSVDGYPAGMELAAATPPGPGELQTYSLVQLTVSRLSREILSGELAPGERLIEEQLTRRLGISRAPLREALRLLAQQGLVEHLPRRGARVAALSEQDVEELYGLREVLERYALEAALPVVDGPELDSLRGALDRMREAHGHDDRLEMAEAHRNFHSALVALAGQRQLQLLYDSVLVKLQLFMAMNLRREAELARPTEGVKRHERLLEAILSGETAAAQTELSVHGARSYLV